MKAFFRIVAEIVFKGRRNINQSIKKFAKNIRDKRILEIGSGKKKGGKYFYSVKRYFDRSNEFIRSDVNKDYGHKVVDVTNMEYKEEFDVILCMSVLEHVYEFERAIANMYKALKKGGVAVIFVPAFYPLHDEPTDYWRFTEHSLRKMLIRFRKVRIRHSGLRKYPSMYYVEAYK